MTDSSSPAAPIASAQSARAGVMTALRQAAAATGTDFDFLVKTARRESNFDPTARAPTSSAAGLFQFTNETWLLMIDRYGAQHGVEGAAKAVSVSDGGRAEVGPGMSREAILELRHDPDLSARMAGELARENSRILGKKIGRTPTSQELYAAHFMGPSEAAKLIEAARRGDPGAASEAFPKAALANANVFRSKDGVQLTAGQLYKRLTGVEIASADGGRIAPAPLAPASTPVRPEILTASLESFSPRPAAAEEPSLEMAGRWAARMGSAQLASSLMTALFELQSDPTSDEA